MNGQSDHTPAPAAPTDAFDPFASGLPFELVATPAQLEMWLSEKSGEGAGCAYNESFTITLQGTVDEAALARALQTLSEFHEALRGRFSEDGQRFLIVPEITVPIARHDLSGLAPDERHAELRRLAHEDSATPYDLEQGPLVRAAILRLDETTCVVLMSVHHAACDGWSLDVLLADLGRLYSAFVGGAALPVPPQHGFGDYVATYFAPETAGRLAACRAFWRTTFKTLPPALNLPHDGRRPALRSYGAEHASLRVSAEMLARLKAFARAHELSLFSVVFSAYAALLHRLSGATDLVIGVPVAGHPEVGMEDAVGHLVNLVPVRFDFTGEPSFATLCQRTAAAMLDARENAWVSFGEIVRDLQMPRDPARVPLVAATFTHVQKYAPGKLVFAGSTVDYYLNPRVFETFEISLNALEAHDGLLFHAHANSDLYSEAWLGWRLRELVCLLQEGCAAPDVPLGQLPILPAEERAVVTEGFNPTAVDYPRDESLAGFLATRISRHPNAPALRFGDARLTHADLAARAHQLAHALRARSVARGQLVGICLERSPDMVAAMLAVLEAGAGYIPLDPGFPVERLAYMVEDSRLALVISDTTLAEVHGCPREKTLALDADGVAIAAHPRAALAAGDGAARPDDVAYVLYTSGSTGKPKGVAVPHRAAVNFLVSMAREPGLAATDRLLAVTTLSFDIALLELLLPLSVGAEIILATREQAMDGEALRRLIEQLGVTVMQATPATWRLLLASGFAGGKTFKGLCGGEAMPADLAEALLARIGELWNMYGPTETTVWSTCGRVTTPRQGITIGRPIANTTIRILDGRLQLSPIGVPGEIYIGGDGVAVGYLGRPELTAERFIADPFGQAGERIYKTGDLGRWRSDGELDCLGRVDFQVKVRGYRIELGEIEAVLAKHATVAQAVVMAREDRPGDVRLVAYLRTRGNTLDEADLRAHLRRAVPEYMVPQHFVAMTEFPTTPNGKIDRKALPAPDASPVVAAVQAPVTPTEIQIAKIWQDLLGRAQCGRDENFFDLGGHSLLAVTLVTEIKKQMGAQLPLAQVLRSPTIAGLGAAIDAVTQKQPEIKVGDDPDLVEIRPGGPRRLFFVFDGFGEIMPYLTLARRLPPRYAIWGILPRRLPSIPMAHATVEDMAGHCIATARKLQPAGPYLVGGLCAGGVVAFAMAEQLEREHDTVERLVLLDAVAPTTAKRRGRVAARRWQRFSSTLRQMWGGSGTGDDAGEDDASDSSAAAEGGSNGGPAQPTPAASAAAQALGKVRNVIAYESQRYLTSLSVAARYRLLERVLATKGEWPAWAPPLSVEDIYGSARERYVPGRVTAPVILVRAGTGEDADAPATELVTDPLLGWGERSAQAVAVIDAPGGHSSMLQEPSVAVVAEQLLAHLESAR